VVAGGFTAGSGGFATRDWRAAVVAAGFAVGMMALSLRVSPRIEMIA
jgi:hypothetical protein